MPDLIPFSTKTDPAVTYNRAPIRVVLLDGKPWWDTAQMFRLVHERISEKLLSTFSLAEMGWHLFEGTEEPLHVVSTTGALTIVSQLPWRANEMAYGWLRKKHGVLTAPAGSEPKRMPLVLLANGALPPVPLYSNERAEWHALNEAKRAQRIAATAIPPSLIQ